MSRKRITGSTMLAGFGCIALLVFAVSGRNVVAASNATDFPNSLAQLPTMIRDRINAGIAQDVIVLFDDSTVQKDTQAMKQAEHMEIDDASILAYKKQAYASIKRRAVSALGPDVAELRQYEYLPFTFVRVKSGRALQQLATRQDVHAIYENKAYQANLSQSLPLIGQPTVQASGKTGSGTMVAVLDTGVEYSRSAFSNNGATCVTPGNANCRVAVAMDFAPQDNQQDADPSKHGTNVAGIVVGVAPGAVIAALDVFNGVSAYTSDLLSAINWVIQNASARHIVAMNLSLGIYGNGYATECTNSWAKTSFQSARSAGVLPVVAAGNDAFSNGVEDPACAPGAVRVGAVYDSDVGSRSWTSCVDSTTGADMIACFSNSAPILTMLAPGAIITAAGLSFGGTSQAAPHVAGAAAVLRAFDTFPGDTLNQTVQRMTSTGRPILDTRNGLTRPRLDLAAAVGPLPPPVANLNWLVPVLGILLD